jgi:hypothetical protein
MHGRSSDDRLLLQIADVFPGVSQLEQDLFGVLSWLGARDLTDGGSPSNWMGLATTNRSGCAGVWHEQAVRSDLGVSWNVGGNVEDGEDTALGQEYFAEIFDLLIEKVVSSRRALRSSPTSRRRS